MNELDIELTKAKQKVKDIKKLKRLRRKLNRAERVAYQKPIHIFIDLVDTICFTFRDMVWFRIKLCLIALGIVYGLPLLYFLVVR